MAACDFLKFLHRYDSSKVIHFHSLKYGCMKWIFHIFVGAYVGYTLIVDRRYQEKDNIISSVHTKVKGVAQTGERIWDTAEYTIPMQGVDSFFVITNIIMTENQLQRRCPEYPVAKAICFSDKSCKKGSVDHQSNGIQTGRCVNYNATVKTCEVVAWCPVESKKTAPVPAVLKSSEDFTVLIKNNIHFPKFNYTTQNIPSNFNSSCTFNKITSPLCPVFRLGDILQAANENFSEVAVEGGIIGIEINWDCSLDKWFYYCSPKYGFRRLDDKTTSKYPGFNFRFAKYYKLHNGEEQRTLLKVYGIRFDVLVFGTAGKFDVIELVTYIGSMISYFGLAVVVIDLYISLYSCCSCCKSPVKEYHFRKKYETVLNPRQVLYVSYVDEPHVTLIKKRLKTSLQHTTGDVVESHPEKASDANCCTSNSDRDPVTEEPEMYPLQRPRQRASSPDRPAWCCCGKCQLTEKYHEQLCCRRKEGKCITTSPLFERLVLSRNNLKNILLYKEPFLDLNSKNVNDRLRHCAFKQYVRWRFGSFDLENRAVIPSCCRWQIRDTYPKADGKYTGFKTT
ncbi:P2X purinoceptor 7 isoform X2 [Struthio camelus]|uniref:P2X purinoceptor 7 isoform X2 n=1 Tax=Struthio camelus TaxID=8801 RepID=UPI00051E2658|nr:PREDICTED: P2X purinoceptor 7 isoform X2 [Struthio camelus australis]